MNVYMIVRVVDGDIDVEHYWTEEAREKALVDTLLPVWKRMVGTLDVPFPATATEALEALCAEGELDFDIALREIDMAQIDDAEQPAPHLRTFRVRTTRDVTESVFLDVVAVNGDAAQDAAWDRLRASDDMTNAPKKNELYKWTAKAGEEPVFGTFLTEDSDGHWVMQMADGDKNLVRVEPGLPERVLPYTVKVHPVGGGRSGFDLKTKKGSVQADDLIMLRSGMLVRVAKLDSKSDKPDLETLRGHILSTRPIGNEDDTVVE